MEETYVEVYQKAKRLGEQEVRRAVSEGRYPYLHALAHFLPDYGTMSKFPVGVKEIPLSMIAGTVTEERQNSFARNFMPVMGEKTEFAVKWEKLYAAQRTEGIKEAVRCYEYMNRFYILEGNKRVSVLNYVGAYSIAADIERILPPKTDDRETQVYYEFLDFFKVTGLYEITFSEKGSYKKLAELYGMTLDKPWPEDRIASLRADFRTFSAAFQALGGDGLKMTPGDAFIIYLSIYPGTEILEESRGTIEQRIRGIWNELISATKEDEIAVVENPDQDGRKLTFRSFFGGKPVYTKENPLRIAFIYAKEPKSSRWIYSHELGRTELNENFDGIVDANAFTGCSTEEKVDAAFEAAAADQDAVVFTTSPDMMDASMRAAIRWPEMKILNCSINLTSSAVRTYYPKLYEAKFLMGALAASFSDDHRIGYVADYPLNGSIANINAFAIGAGLVDPAAKIYLTWTGRKDSDWQKELEDERGLKVISGPDVIRPDQSDRKYGVYKILPDGTAKKLAAPIHHWGKFYTAIVQTIMDGTWSGREKVEKTQPINYWFGLASGAVDVIFSDELPYYSRKMIQLFRRGLLDGAVVPFRGEMHSQKGQITEMGHPQLSNREVIEMNWLNDNVIGEIPGPDELIDSVQKTLDKSGVAAKETL